MSASGGQCRACEGLGWAFVDPTHPSGVAAVDLQLREWIGPCPKCRTFKTLDAAAAVATASGFPVAWAIAGFDAPPGRTVTRVAWPFIRSVVPELDDFAPWCAESPREGGWELLQAAEVVEAAEMAVDAEAGAGRDSDFYGPLDDLIEGVPVPFEVCAALPGTYSAGLVGEGATIVARRRNRADYLTLISFSRAGGPLSEVPLGKRLAALVRRWSNNEPTPFRRLVEPSDLVVAATVHPASGAIDVVNEAQWGAHLG